VNAPADAPAAVVAHYERAAADYSARRDRGLAGVVRRREQAAVLELLGPGGDVRVLDAGCGDGAFAARLAVLGAAVVAVDLTLPMALLAARRGVGTVVADMRALPFAPVFDRVTCIGASEFVPDLGAVAGEFARCLRRGGALVLLAPRRNALGLLYWLFHRRRGVRISLRSRRAITATLAAAGFGRPQPWRRLAVAWACRVALPAAPVRPAVTT
jgi:SAM-dependent methyltransferase